MLKNTRVTTSRVCELLSKIQQRGSTPPPVRLGFNMRDIIIYAAQQIEKYLLKRSLMKHSCSWQDKLIIL